MNITNGHYKWTLQMDMKMDNKNGHKKWTLKDTSDGHYKWTC